MKKSLSNDERLTILEEKIKALFIELDKLKDNNKKANNK